ncbi:hypothetical protein [Paenibacillus riograndensis]|uniref:Uncharacterized protein n=1 Tax=Paenibacillus riograndensis SBR5 TaxID=1073571 RepID=A0A0E4HBH2_9BACL|nr:hypothetical protein [Paenibacillus riograndensis]CQR53473.1 hypothetical protein PRIO_1387 [Paenibacillus riograndensis SBR5]
MSIYHSIDDFLHRLESTLISNKEPVDANRILAELRASYNEVGRYGGKLYLKYADEIKAVLEYSEEVVISKAMYSEFKQGFRQLKKLWQAKRNVESFYIHCCCQIRQLLIFNRVSEEHCRSCHGTLLYYYEENSQMVMKKCQVCRRIYSSRTGTLIPASEGLKLSRASKQNLQEVVSPAEWIGYCGE